MGKPYSLNLRGRIMAHVEAGHPARAAGRAFGVSASTAVRLMAAWRRRARLAAGPARAGLRRRDLGQDGPQP